MYLPLLMPMFLTICVTILICSKCFTNISSFSPYNKCKERYYYFPLNANEETRYRELR